MKDIYVFICEDKELARDLISKYMNKDQITYTSLFPESERSAISDALDKIESDREYEV